jgi:hypothetical protein
VVIPADAAAVTGGMFTDTSTEAEYRHDTDMDTHLFSDHLQTFQCGSQEHDPVTNPDTFNIIS